MVKKVKKSDKRWQFENFPLGSFLRNEFFNYFPNRFQLFSERNGASPDDFTKWEVAKIA